MFECDCGFEVQFEERWNGIAYYPAFLDEQGEEITHCPACGEWLRGVYEDRRIWRPYSSVLKKEPRLRKRSL